MRVVALLIASLALQGCVASVASTIVTAPFKVVGKTADILTTSQEEADRNRGRAIRKQEERDAKEQRKAAKQERKEREEQGY
jgi:hypothetical protein